MTDANRLISHGVAAKAATSHEQTLKAVKARLRAGGDMPEGSLDEQLSLADALSTFELGRFLLAHRGLDAYWTHRIVTYVPGSLQKEKTSPLEHVLFERLPAVLATRERFAIFRRELQAMLKPGMVLASVPCGWMGDLLSLDYSAVPGVSLIGLDLDPQALTGAHALAKKQDFSGHLSLRQVDAWNMHLYAQADVLTSNGLNIYEPDEARVTALYRQFFDALKPGGWLVTSFLTPPPSLSAQSPWEMSAISSDILALQHMLFARVIDARWSAFRTHAETLAQLESVGFTHIRFINDRACMFPTVVAHKPALD